MLIAVAGAIYPPNLSRRGPGGQCMEHGEHRGCADASTQQDDGTVTWPVDVIASAGGTLAALAAKRATTSIPIVLLGVGDPVAEGLVASLAHPSGNITGLSAFTPELIGKRLELLKQAVPGVSLIAFLLKPDAAPSMEAGLKARSLPTKTLSTAVFMLS